MAEEGQVKRGVANKLPVFSRVACVMERERESRLERDRARERQTGCVFIGRRGR